MINSENLKGGKNDSMIRKQLQMQLQNIGGPPTRGRKLKIGENNTQDITLPIVFPSSSKAQANISNNNEQAQGGEINNDSIISEKAPKGNAPYNINNSYLGYIRQSKSRDKSNIFN